MKRTSLIVFAVVAGVLFVPAPGPSFGGVSPSSRVAAADASRYIDEEATVCGVVAGTYYAAGARGRPTFLDFDHAYPEEVFRVVIWGEDREKFSQPPERLYGGGKRFCVTGRIQLYRGKPEIVVRDGRQVRPAAG